ncbi:MAG: protein translocase subunit SecF [Deltaproteobacteria bacterium]|nr:protein translocase subunit SecF [Deltaproteobacteria bacterium]
MEFIRPGTHVDFIGKRTYALCLSCLVITAAIISLFIHGGPRYGIDFAGGVLVQVKFAQETNAHQIKEALRSINLHQSMVQQFEEKGKHEFLIQVQETDIDLQNLDRQITDALTQGFGKDTFEVWRVEMVGPKVGKDLRKKGLLSVVYAVIFMLIYITWRFEFRFGVGAVIAVIHDVLITVGAFSLTNREITLPIVAAFLTIVGYSINDTIVVYDRIRENRRKKPNDPLAATINLSINETLSRTILTSATTLLVVVALFIFGGGVIHDFAFALLVGIIVGTYSSVFIASPILLLWETVLHKRRKRS